jgi:hypothetical protein
LRPLWTSDRTQVALPLEQEVAQTPWRAYRDGAPAHRFDRADERLYDVPLNQVTFQNDDVAALRAEAVAHDLLRDLVLVDLQDLTPAPAEHAPGDHLSHVARQPLVLPDPSGEIEVPRHRTVVLLDHSAGLDRAHFLDEPGLLEFLDVIVHPTPGAADPVGYLLCGPGPLNQERQYPHPLGVRKRLDLHVAIDDGQLSARRGRFPVPVAHFHSLPGMRRMSDGSRPTGLIFQRGHLTTPCLTRQDQK